MTDKAWTRWKAKLCGNWLRAKGALAGTGFLGFAVAGIACPPVITNPPSLQAIFLGDPVTFSAGDSFVVLSHLYL